MSLSMRAKELSIATGLYRAARWLSRRLRPEYLRRHRGHIALYRSLLPPHALCFDVGANIGEVSEALLEAGARVVAFEPNPQALSELHARCDHRAGWTPVETALGSAPSITKLFARESHAQSGLLEGWGGEVVATYHVPVLTLDLAIEAFGTPDYCKIDVEGWELEVLKGLTRPLPLVSLEYHLEDEDIEKTLACLRRLAEHATSELNLTAAEGYRFHFDEWLPLPRFLEVFPGTLRETLPAPHYGDIFIRMKSG